MQQDAELTAEEYKAKGNELFKERNFLLALHEYTQAIVRCQSSINDDGDEVPPVEEDNPNLHVYLCNRAFCHMKLENYGFARIDAQEAATLKPGFAKAHYRVGCAQLALGKVKEARLGFKAAVHYAPTDKDAAQRLKECEKLEFAQKFASAIGLESTKPASESVDLSAMEVDEKYAGPRYEPGTMTQEFLDQLTSWQQDQKILHRKFAYSIVLDVLKLLRTLPTLVRLNVPEAKELTVCGDIHGQYYDLLNIFAINGKPSEENPYVFNGDMVDRGSFSVECILLLFAYKLLYPGSVHLARGNHETQSMNSLYGFQGEVKAKYDEKLNQLFSETFRFLPLAHCINEKVLVVHGGLFSKDGVTLKDIEAIDRNGEPPDAGLFVELLWSDPQEMNGRGANKRGVGVSFGPDVTRQFLEDNDLELIVRSHEMKMDGYEEMAGGKLITVFSAPNYCDQMGNRGAFIRFTGIASGGVSKKIQSFAAVPHPNVPVMQYASPVFHGGGMGV